MQTFLSIFKWTTKHLYTPLFAGSAFALAVVLLRYPGDKSMAGDDIELAHNRYSHVRGH
jgi:hypothetical protein